MLAQLIIRLTGEAQSASKLAVQKGFNYQSQCKIELMLVAACPVQALA